MPVAQSCKRLLLMLSLALPGVTFSAQQYDQKLFTEMRWRCIGPFRGGRTVAITGVAGQPAVFYMAAVNGGVWKRDDFGNTWKPSLMTNRVARSGHSPLHPRIRISSMQAVEKASNARTSRWATESTNPQMQGRLGRI